MTNNNIINKDLLYKEGAKIEIDIKEETETKILYLNNRMKYTDKEYDITIIEVKEADNINNYLELDDVIMNDLLNNINKNKEFKNETIYIIQYPENKLSVSYGILDKIYEDKKYNFNHKCVTRGGSSGSPILNMNNKLIGIHKEGKNNKLFNIGLFLNEPIKKFIQSNDKNNEILLKEFNEKYKLNIPNINVDNLNLIGKRIGNEGFKDLVNIEFKELKELYLNENSISDINVLEKAKFEKLEIISFSGSQISDINVLEKVNFKNLKVLFFLNNKIEDIKVLEKVKFEKLEKLNLAENEILNINVLKKVNFKELKELYLYRTNTPDIKFLENPVFKKLEILDLGGNRIKNINTLINIDLREIKELNLDNNDISDITVLRNVEFGKLEILRLDRNEIDPSKNKINLRKFPLLKKFRM